MSAPMAIRPHIDVTMPQTAMVLAAGLGKRMRPLTATRPKPLVEVAGRTLLDRALDRVEAAGIGTAVVNAHYFADQIDAAVRARKGALEIRVSDEREQLLETGGGVVKAMPLIDADPFFVINADNMWVDGSADTLRLMAQRWDPDTMDVLLLLVPLARAAGYDGRGDFHLDPCGLVRPRGEVRVAPFVYSGILLISNACSMVSRWSRFRSGGNGTRRWPRAACSGRFTRGCGSTSARRRASVRPRPCLRPSDRRFAG